MYAIIDSQSEKLDPSNIIALGKTIDEAKENAIENLKMDAGWEDTEKETAEQAFERWLSTPNQAFWIVQWSATEGKDGYYLQDEMPNGQIGVSFTVLDR